MNIFRPLDVEAFTPEECGWLRVGHPAARMWEKPDGTLYVFPPKVPELLQRMQAIE